MLGFYNGLHINTKAVDTRAVHHKLTMCKRTVYAQNNAKQE